MRQEVALLHLVDKEREAERQSSVFLGPDPGELVTFQWASVSVSLKCRE